MSEAKELFQEIRNIDKQINSKFEHLERLKSLATKVTTVMRDDAARPTGTSRGVENNVIKIVSLQDEINEDIDRFVEMKKLAVEIIRQIPDEKHRRCLEERYLNGKTFELIATEMGYSYFGICKMHGSALQNAEAVLKKMFSVDRS